MGHRHDDDDGTFAPVRDDPLHQQVGFGTANTNVTVVRDEELPFRQHDMMLQQVVGGLE